MAKINKNIPINNTTNEKIGDNIGSISLNFIFIEKKANINNTERNKSNVINLLFSVFIESIKLHDPSLKILFHQENYS